MTKEQERRAGKGRSKIEGHDSATLCKGKQLSTN
jgi:hypothetical protein